MRGRHDVHVCPGAGRLRWRVAQGQREQSSHRTQRSAVQAGRRVARRDHVELVVHGRDGRIHVKESHGREGAARDRA